MRKIIIFSCSLMLTGCASTQEIPDVPTSYIINRKLITIYNPMQDGKYANFSEWGREYARMYSQLGRCSAYFGLSGQLFRYRPAI